ncbi:hypothetical protein [Pontibacter pudoricolor]|uniref:hypothetical protein n=1 Tax=Pontibacter pudoricolor TaxID=2694930 RepID=UPI0013917460|nr:hypothetical protein [Pontibacter pudoricolor]
MLNTPVLFLIFNRPQQTQIVFEKIREVRPKLLFVAADGPREGRDDDIENCKLTRDIATSVDWDCKVVTLFRESNLGCKYAVSSAITWFFEQIEEGIILEDDILPDISFFNYCEELLEKYRFDNRVMHVAGFNIYETWKANNQSFHFSHFGSVWGWASWRRAWKCYDVEVKFWKDNNIQNFILESFFSSKFRTERKQLYDNLYDGRINTWDYQWTLCKLLNNGLSIIPSKNLIENIGFNATATHTTLAPKWAVKKVFSLSFPLKENGKIEVDKVYDRGHLTMTAQVISEKGKFDTIMVFFRYFVSKAYKPIKNCVFNIRSILN